MGKIGRTLMGGPSKQKSSSSSTGTTESDSGNYAYPSIMAAYGPAMGSTAQASSMMGALLGAPSAPTYAPAPAPTYAAPSPTQGQTNPINRLLRFRRGGGFMRDGGFMRRGYEMDDASMYDGVGERPMTQAMFGGAPAPAPAPGTVTTTQAPVNQGDALENFANSAGMKFIRDQGIRTIEGSRAARGMLQSGATGKELMEFGDNLGKTYLDKYMGHVNEMGRLGLGAGGLVAGAGDWSRSRGTTSSTSKGKETGAKKGIIPSIVEAVAKSQTGGAG